MSVDSEGNSPSALVSRRISIKWGDEESNELTSTIVLTSPNEHYVDLRIFLDMREIEWAFSGIVLRSSGSGTWVHWVDSRSESPVSDSGTFETLPNGDVLERGVMRNNEGVLLPYEEIWRDRKVSNTIVVVLVGQTENAVDILRNENNVLGQNGDTIPPGCVGMIIRVGEWCQGVLRRHDGFFAERWHNLSNPEGGGWKLEFATHRGVLPCDRVCDLLDKASKGACSEQINHVGDNFTVDGITWTVVEYLDDGH